jgi:hypothetical protein
MIQRSLLLIVLSSIVVVLCQDKDFFTYGVWYGGGKYRAPIISRKPKEEREQWLSDLKTIKSLGFNSMVISH